MEENKKSPWMRFTCKSREKDKEAEGLSIEPLCYRLDAKMGDVDYLTTTLALFTM